MEEERKEITEDLDKTGLITEEKSEFQKKKKLRPGVIGAVGASCMALFVLVFVFLGAFDGVEDKRETPVSEDIIAQQAYERRQSERARKKAESIKDDAFVPKKFSDTSINDLMKKLQEANKHKSEEPEAPPYDEVAKRGKRESLVNKIITQDRNQGNSRRYVYNSNGSNGSDARQKEKDADLQRQSMFAYSRLLKDAAYYDGPENKKESENQGSVAVYDDLIRREMEMMRGGESLEKAEQKNRPEEKTKEEPNTVYYTALPPVNLHEGEFIDAVLTHRIRSDTQESPVVCTVAKDLHDNSGQYVIIPTGTRIVGRSGVVNYQGADRLFISLHRMILPNGVSVRFPNSKRMMQALDRTGSLGASSHVNRHWWLQFGTAVFIGVLDGLGAAAQRRVDPYSTSAYVVEDTTDNFEKILNTIMQRYSNIVPTITVEQGYPIKIYIAEDVHITPFSLTEDRSYATNY